MNVAIAAPIFAAAGGIIVAAITWLASRGKNNADARLSDAQAAQAIQGAALNLVQPLNNQIVWLRDQLEEVRRQQAAERAEFESRIACLEGKVSRLNVAAQEAEQRAVDAEAERDRLLSN